ncbi:GtrA-like protein [Roseisalinus antarcticus]|uniref:GtrA-like protein n=1 Tax=Roseisalinus antarcticus TaxID=254357 RepID=A0A1Y5U033_9RHOB|nr:GtrA-like protein [Roseisalinus antarcticus]
MTPPRRLLRFGVVGAFGFMVDGGLLWLLVSNDANPFLARGLSFPAAVFTTWWLNRIWTFANATRSSPRRQLNLYFALQVVGSLTNFAVYSVLLVFIEPTPLNALGALAGGAVVGMIVNFLGSQRYVFKTDIATSPKQ